MSTVAHAPAQEPMEGPVEGPVQEPANASVLASHPIDAREALPARRPRAPAWPGAAAWAVAWLLMLALDGQVDLANQALLLILAAAVAAIWWRPLTSALAIAVGVLAFNFVFVPPRGTLAVDLQHHGLLLLAMVSVSWIITALMARLRRLAHEAEAHARRSDELRRVGDALRETEDPLADATALRRLLGRGAERDVVLLVADRTERASTPGDERWFGEASDDERAGLRLCLAEGRGLGPGSGRHEEQPAWYLPVRGRQRTQGAALLRLPPVPPPADDERAHAQALCDQLGAALERAAAERAAVAAQQQAQLQSLRNTLLSAVAHDHRTPLATIVSAAGALHDQAERLDAAQRRRLAATIVDEATQLARITDNTLQLARLDAVGLDLTKDWESVEELIGSVLRRLRQRDPGQRLRARVEPGLPLVRCDAVLVVQLLDNLVDNALRHGGDAGPVEVTARAAPGRVEVAVRDRGPGVSAALAQRLFEPFSRGPTAASVGSRRGAGVGLALGRAIARAHGGELAVRTRRGGGASFEFWLPVQAQPSEPAEAESPDPVEPIGGGAR